VVVAVVTDVRVELTIVESTCVVVVLLTWSRVCVKRRATLPNPTEQVAEPAIETV
jgi:hypothetical protein